MNSLVPTDFRSVETSRRFITCVVASAGFAMCPGAAFGKANKCVDPVTKSVTLSDVPCATDRAPTPAEAAASAEAARLAAIAAEAKQAAARADRQLRDKYVDEAAQRKAEVAEIEETVRKIRFALRRYNELIIERKPLDDQLLFYVGKPVPPALQSSIDKNNASFAALTDVFKGLEQDVHQIVGLYATERARLRALWAGAAPGSMGVLVAASGPAR